MSDEVSGSVSDDRPLTEGQKVERHVRQTIDFIRDGKVTRRECEELRDSANRGIQDHAVSRSIGRNFMK